VVGASTAGLQPLDLTAVATGPVVTAVANVSYVVGAAPVTLDSGLSINRCGAGQPLWGHGEHRRRLPSWRCAECRLSPDGHHQQLQRRHRSVTLSGTANPAAYQTALDSVTHASPTATNSSRTITWSVNDGLNTSIPVSSHVSVSGVPRPDSGMSGPDLSILLQNAGATGAVAGARLDAFGR
jgi:hypothetical protein